MLAIAQAAANSGGIVIAQVEKLVKRHTLNPWMVKVPGIIVDYVVVAKKENHWQTFSQEYNPSLSGEIKTPGDAIPKMAADERKIICTRALQEIKENDVVNLGIGLPEGISMVANEKGVFGRMNLTVEAGIIGGIPVGGLKTLAPLLIRHALSTSHPSLIFTMAADWILLFWGWPRLTLWETSM